MSNVNLQVRNLVKRFGGLTAVDGVSFDVHDGEILGLIGPNGSGKSTLFNCILGQYQPDQGEVLLKNKPITNLAPHELNRFGISRTFQMLQVFRELSVLENLIFSGQEHQGTMISRLFGKPDAGLTKQALEILDFFKLSRLKDEKAGSLSYGQQKLLDAAMAFMAGPSLVLLDEPAGGVNLTMLGDFLNHLKAWNHEKKTTFVVIEHNMEFVTKLCSRVIVLAAGKIIAEGSAMDVRNNPLVIESYLGG